MQILTFTKSKIRIILYGVSTFATMVVAAPSLAAITHWFAPFPPKPIRNSDPKIVSPGLQQAIKTVLHWLHLGNLSLTATRSLKMEEMNTMEAFLFSFSFSAILDQS